MKKSAEEYGEKAPSFVRSFRAEKSGRAKRERKRKGVFGKVAIRGICPFYEKEKDGELFCEGATVFFPDKIGRREIVYRFCAHPQNYKICVIYKMLCGYYARKEMQENEKTEG